MDNQSEPKTITDAGARGLGNLPPEIERAIATRELPVNGDVPFNPFDIVGRLL